VTGTTTLKTIVGQNYCEKACFSLPQKGTRRKNCENKPRDVTRKSRGSSPRYKDSKRM
jgi:hypothetical protein